MRSALRASGHAHGGRRSPGSRRGDGFHPRGKLGSQLFGDCQRDSCNSTGWLVATVEVAIDFDQLLERALRGDPHVQHLAPPGAAVDMVYESGGVTIESGRTPVAAGMSIVAGSGVVARRGRPGDGFGRRRE